MFYRNTAKVNGVGDGQVQGGQRHTWQAYRTEGCLSSSSSRLVYLVLSLRGGGELGSSVLLCRVLERNLYLQNEL